MPLVRMLQPLRTIGLVLALMGLACTASAPELPPGFHLVGRSADVGVLLDTLLKLDGTPLADLLGDPRRQLEACPDLAALSLTEGAASLSCTPEARLGPLTTQVQQGQLPFILPAGTRGRGQGAVFLAATGGLRVQTTVPTPESGSLWDLLVPGEGSPGAAVLADASALIHVRVAQQRIPDLGTLVADDDQGQELFALKSSIFARTVLAGVWELAVYPPPEGRGAPSMALAVGVRSEDIARQALDQWIDQLQARWSLAVVPGADGSSRCMPGLRLLPALQPCWDVSGSHIIVGWNPSSLHQARASSSGWVPATSGARVALGRFSEVDRQISRLMTPDAPPPRIDYPWSALSLEARSVDDSIELVLVADPP